MSDGVPLEELRLLCAKHWNPIGIPMDNATTPTARTCRPLPADEYDAYLNRVWGMTMLGLPATEIFNYLSTVETDLMALSAPSGDKDAFVAALRERWTRG